MRDATASAPPSAGAPLRHCMRAVRAARAVLHAILGAPDYERYAAHVRARHPDRAPMTRDEFARERLAARYDRPGARCC